MSAAPGAAVPFVWPRAPPDTPASCSSLSLAPPSLANPSSSPTHRPTPPPPSLAPPADHHGLVCDCGQERAHLRDGLLHPSFLHHHVHHPCRQGNPPTHPPTHPIHLFPKPTPNLPIHTPPEQRGQRVPQPIHRALLLGHAGKGHVGFPCHAATRHRPVQWTGR